MQEYLLDGIDSDDLAVFVVWTSQVGAQEKHAVDATSKIQDSRVTQYWDPDKVMSKSVQEVVDSDMAAWDIYMLFDRDAVWEDPAMLPHPVHWEHQLKGLPAEKQLDAKRFVGEAAALLKDQDE